MKTVLAICLLALVGCDRPLTNEEIVQQTQYCRAHHLRPLAYTTLPDSRITAIQCDTTEVSP